MSLAGLRHSAQGGLLLPGGSRVGLGTPPTLRVSFWGWVAMATRMMEMVAIASNS